MSAEASEAPPAVVGFQCQQRHDEQQQRQQLEHQQQLELEAAVPVPQTPRRHQLPRPSSLLTAALQTGAACWLSAAPHDELDDDSELSDEEQHYEGSDDHHYSPVSAPIDIPCHLAQRSRWWTAAPAYGDYAAPAEQPCVATAARAAMPLNTTEVQQQQHQRKQ